MNLLQLLLGTLTSNDSVNSVSKKTGVSSGLVSKLMIAAIPLLISYMTKNASKKEGAQSLLGALTQHTSNQTVSQQLANADDTDGAKIIGHILGQDQNAIVSNLANQTGLNSNQVNAVLNNIAPALLNSLSTATTATANAQTTTTTNKKKKTQAASQQTATQSSGVNLADGIDLSDLVGLLGGSGATAQQTQQQANSGLDLLGSLLGGTQQQTQQSSGLGNMLGSLLGGSQQQTQQSSGLGNMLGSLLGGTSQQTTTTSQADGSELLGLLTGLLK